MCGALEHVITWIKRCYINLLDWLIAWLIDWLIAWLIDSKIDDDDSFFLRQSYYCRDGRRNRGTVEGQCTLPNADTVQYVVLLLVSTIASW